MSQERRGPWYLLTGLVLGLAFGLVFAWVVSPVKIRRYLAGFDAPGF